MCKSVERKSEELIFVGHYEDMKAYLLFDSTYKELMFKSDVHFNENSNPQSSSHPSSSLIIEYGYNNFDDSHI